MKSRSPLLIVYLALALTGSALTGWLHPAAAAQGGSDICSANSPRTAGPATNTGDPQPAHDCGYCGSVPASGMVDLPTTAANTVSVGNTCHRTARRAARRDRLNAEPRAPPARA